ncbi:hypothetical protein PFISCL1PPCAC_27677 [Pristionchus fissidentatus]|uniref:Peptidase S1 domain-containing protein n=1 Tax=Pristionchus fissidentatus TaxID=1538716 RepID=A0AAV5WY05_9BILA|nr:hypothetical protein PFISCL1PPCAC_27677 [Pristionchus fissidentatus]
MLSMKVLFLFLSLAAISNATCGRPYPEKNAGYHKIYKRVIGGNEVHVGKWPWQVMLVINTAVLNKTTMEVEQDANMCGGTVISDRFILTAAHCTPPQSVIQVYSGIIHGNRYEADITEKKLISAVEMTIPHPEYNDTTDDNDIAILRLEEPLVFGHNVSPICLPNKDQSIPDDGQAVVVGFGETYREDAGNWDLKDDERLRESAVTLIRPEICEDRRVNDTMNSVTRICAGSSGHGTAPGDSGGPLLMKEERGRWFQIGITSYGDNDEEVLLQDDYPGVYTNVKAYCDWIKEATDEEVSCADATVNLKDIPIA